MPRQKKTSTVVQAMMEETPKKRRTTKAKEEVKAVEPVKESPVSRCWKAMDKIDKRLFKQTNALVETIVSGQEEIRGLLSTETDQDKYRDMTDYLEWLQKLHDEIEGYSRFWK